MTSLLIVLIALDVALLLFAVLRPWRALLVLIGGLPFNGLLLDVVGPRLGVVDPSSLTRIALAAWHDAIALGIIAAAGLAVLQTRNWRLSRVELAGAVLLALALIPLFGSPNLVAGLYAYRTLYLPIALMLGLLALARSAGLPGRLPGSVATAVIATSLIASAYAWAQVYILGFPYLLGFPLEDSFSLQPNGLPSAYVASYVHQPRAIGTFHSPNEFGAYLFIAFLTTVTPGILPLGKWRPWIAAALATTAVLTFSRSAWLAALVAIAVVVLMSGWRPSIRSMPGLRTTAAISVFLVATGLVLVTSGGDRYLIATLTGREPSAAGHIGQLQDAFGGTDPQQSPAPGLEPGAGSGGEPSSDGTHSSWLGDGLGTAGTKSERFSESSQLQRHSEIWYVTYTMQVGIAGLLLTGAFVVVILMTLWSTRSSSWSRLAGGLLIGIGVGAFFIHVVNDPAVAVPLWTLVGLGVAQPAVVSGSARTALTGADAGAAQ
jgi:hypothetical protein